MTDHICGAAADEKIKGKREQVIKTPDLASFKVTDACLRWFMAATAFVCHLLPIQFDKFMILSLLIHPQTPTRAADRMLSLPQIRAPLTYCRKTVPGLKTAGRGAGEVDQLR